MKMLTDFKVLFLICVMAFLAFPTGAQAAFIANGNFSSGFVSWDLDTDGSPGGAPDFQIVMDGSNNQAQIKIDYLGDSAWFSNTMYQSPDFSGAAGSTLALSFDWKFNGEVTSNPVYNDIFSTYFADADGNTYDQNGDIGFLLQTTSYSDSWNSFDVDATAFLNQTGFTLEFQLASSGEDDGMGDFWGSAVLIDNVTLTETPIPIPSAIILLGSGILGLVGFNRYRGRS